MLQDLVGELEARLGKDRASNFRGTALIRFESLKFEKRPNEVKTKRLVRIMRKEGCYRVEPLNRIKAVVREGDLNDAITASGITPQNLLNNPNGVPPSLVFPKDPGVQCLEGASRIDAAKKVLRPQDYDWAIDLFLTDTTSEHRRVQLSRTLNEGPLEDLEIYFNIRQAQLQAEELEEGQWRVRLPHFKQRYLNQFLKHNHLVTAVDHVLRMPGQRFGMVISHFHELLGCNCYEEFLQYVHHIDRIWSRALEYDEELICQLDRETVEATQLRAPARSSVDHEYLQKQVKERSILGFVQDERDKERILNNLLQIDTLIPSMQSLGQDAKTLKFHAEILTSLFGDSDESLRSRLRQSFSGTNQRSGYFRIQESELVLREYPGGLNEQENLGIAQLWLVPGRHFPQMGSFCPRQDGSKPAPQRESHIIWYRFAALAYQLGFESPKIHELLSGHQDEKLAGTMLLDARPPPYYEYEQRQFERLKKQMSQGFAQAKEVSEPQNSPHFLLRNDKKSIRRRCGRPSQTTLEFNRCRLFLSSFFEHNAATDQGLSPLFVTVSGYKAFLGDLFEHSAERLAIHGDLGTPEIPVISLSSFQKRTDGSDAEEKFPALHLQQELYVAGQADVAVELKQLQDQSRIHLTTVEELEHRMDGILPAEEEDQKSILTKENERLKLRHSESEKKIQDLEARVRAQSMTIEDRLSNELPWSSREAEFRKTISSLQSQLTRKEKLLTKSRSTTEALKKTSRPAKLIRNHIVG